MGSGILRDRRSRAGARRRCIAAAASLTAAVTGVTLACAASSSASPGTPRLPTTISVPSVTLPPVTVPTITVPKINPPKLKPPKLKPPKLPKPPLPPKPPSPPTLPGVPGAPGGGLPGPITLPGGVMLPSLGPYVEFGRVTYTDSASPYDPKLQLIIVQATSKAKAYVARLKAENPNIRVLAYQSFWLRPSADPQGQTGCLRGSGKYPSNWFMTSSSGHREVWHWPSGLVYQMNFANAAYRQACAQHAIQMARSIGADGVFFDGLATSVFWGALGKSCSSTARGASATCTSNANWQNAMAGALTYLSGRLHAAHLMVIGNVVGGDVPNVGGGGPALWRRYNRPMDGAMEESWVYGTNHRPLPASRVQAGISNVAWSEANGKYTIVNDDITNCSSCSGYGMAALMLVGQGHSSYDLSSGSYTTYSKWWDSYGKGAGMGVALGKYDTLKDGLLVRHFLNGLIVVNDTANPIVDALFGKVPADSAVIR